MDGIVYCGKGLEAEMSYRYIAAPWGPYCWDCDGSGRFENDGPSDDDYDMCVDCAGTGRAAIPWSELFTHGGTSPGFPLEQLVGVEPK